MNPDVILQIAEALKKLGLQLPFGQMTPTNDEEAFKEWYKSKAQSFPMTPNPDDPGQFYNFRDAFRAGASPDTSGHWPSEFKMPGHPSEVVGGFNTRTGKRVPGTKIESAQWLIEHGWSPEEVVKMLRENPQ